MDVVRSKMKSFVPAITVALSILASSAAGRKFTVENNCDFTVWYVSSYNTLEACR